LSHVSRSLIPKAIVWRIASGFLRENATAKDVYAASFDDDILKTALLDTVADVLDSPLAYADIDELSRLNIDVSLLGHPFEPTGYHFGHVVAEGNAFPEPTLSLNDIDLNLGALPTVGILDIPGLRAADAASWNGTSSVVFGGSSPAFNPVEVQLINFSAPIDFSVFNNGAFSLGDIGIQAGNLLDVSSFGNIFGGIWTSPF